MNYDETLHYLFIKLPIFTRIGAAAYKADLKNTIALCNALGHPETKFKSIHIAGTNGKGSCSHMIASIFQSAGYKTALYTSPHVIDFRERIKINGIQIEKEWVVAFTQKLIPLIESIQPSFFEVTVAMAFTYFAENNVDIAIIETGLGGLLDSTNVIVPELSIITNISLDHTNLLGDSIEKIAVQKAGIIKQNIPIVIGEYDPLTSTIFNDIANKQNSSIQFANQKYSIQHFVLDDAHLFIDLQNDLSLQTQHYKLELTGYYQLKNIKTVLTALDVLQNLNWKISEDDIKNGLNYVKKNTGIIGRFDLLQKNPKIIVDVAHNEAGLNEVLQQIAQLKYTNLHVVIGFVQDKDVDNVLKIFPLNALYYFTQANIPRALPSEQLTLKAIATGLNGKDYNTIHKAMVAAFSNATTDDLILVTGSFFILADVYEWLENKNKT